MIELDGYSITEEVYSDNKVLIYRGLQKPNAKPVILKTLNTEYPSPEEINQIQHEYDITRQLNLTGSVRPYGLAKHQNRLILVLEDIGGDSLRNVIADRRINIETFLKIAMQLAHAIGELHQHNIIHKDIKPSNIISNLEAEKIKITDFSISTRLQPNQTHLAVNPDQIEGTLAYISPEQTGRMNRNVDYRTDFYALGVTFYEMLVGWLPFQTTDSMELVHFHIAKQPIAPHNLNPEIPQPLSNIIMKLMAKNPDERYQSAYGLETDLQICWNGWSKKHEIPNFILAQKDTAGIFQIPNKIYGRTRELSLLLDTFRYTTFGHRGFVVVSGDIGMGKTALVNELQQHIHRKHGLFISGKFNNTDEQDVQHLPYSAVIQALRDLMLQLLTETASKMNQWKHKLLLALGDNAQVIVDVIPELEMLIGKQPPVNELTPTENQHRFHLVFLNFLRVFAHHEHPLVIFLDSLQWADNASLQLLHTILTDENTSSVLIIAGVRPIEGQNYVIEKLVQEAEKHHIKYESIHLQALRLEDIEQIVADTLHCTLNYAHSLAELLLSKTEGNPFFINEFLENLYKENLLRFNFKQKQWEWDVKEILAMDMTDNVVALTEQRMQKLSEPAQKLLRAASCIGMQFDVPTLSQIVNQSSVDTAGILWEAVEENLIIPLGEAYHSLYSSSELEQQSLDFSETTYRFMHDRVHQTAYHLLEEQEKQHTHYQFGRILRENIKPGHLEEHLFEIVHHLNLGIGMIQLEAEQFDLARLNLSVGKKAKASSAYESAANYFNTALSLLPQNSWQRQYHLSLSLYIHTMDVAYLNAEVERAEQLFQHVMLQANSLLDQVKAYELKILYYASQNKMHKALEIGSEVLKLLNIAPPDENADLQALFIELRQLMQNRGIDDLAQLPKMRDKHKQAALRILVSMSAPSYLAAPKLYPIICYQQVRLSVEYGNSDLSAYAYASYSMILCGILNDIDAGYQFGKLALNVLDKYNNKDFTAKVLMLVNVCARHCKEPARNTIDPLKIAMKNGMKTGDIEYACYASMFRNTYQFLIGERLNKVTEEGKVALEVMQKFSQQYQSYYMQVWLQLFDNLQTKTVDPFSLKGTFFDETGLVSQLEKQNNILPLFAFYFAKALLCYIMRKPTEALVNAELAERHIMGGNAFLHYTTYKFFYSLIILANYEQADKETKKRYLSQLQQNQTQLQIWVSHAPANYQHKYDLISAEQARLTGKVHQAMAAYEQAIHGAKQQGFLQEEALANELAAEFYASLGIQKVAQVYFTDAHYAYRHWGATLKVKELEVKHPYLAHRPKPPESISKTASLSTKTSAATLQGMSNFDLLSVMKASQTISSEIVLDKLTERLLKIVMENMGAQRGVLILRQNEQMSIEAEIRTGQNTNDPQLIHQTATIDLTQQTENASLPVSLIQYVLRTKNHLVLDSAMKDQRFNGDAYILHHRPQSILVHPLINQGRLVGLLYLENNLMTRAFTAESLNILRLLSSQMAISLDNALFYKKLQAAREEAETANKAKSAFLMNMSHELRTPLNAILGYADLIHEDAQDMGYQDILPDLDRIQTAGKQLLEIISNVLDISKIEADKMGLSLTNFNIEQLVNDVVTVIQPSTLNNELLVTCEKDLGMMHADQIKLQQILLNLLSNALKFTQNGKVWFYIKRQRAYPKEGNSRSDWIYFEVKDTGIGMDEDQVRHAFEAFNQLDNSTTRQYGGTGLGLTISHHFCRMMGGEIKVTSQLGKGSTFAVRLAAYMGDIQ
ncbi:AAA family ATPase [Candidatus Albibeggiatoa sp. nov. NOAA]|uniref:protein kinase domain-containing protein n=1 Tax=Candidatus Albibeggiatoa sp. nov. NOAA TaxID=3162724 RepID=UPI0032F408B2|nr:AAA family ATPase [Thiotrichaceae bacterium]